MKTIRNVEAISCAVVLGIFAVAAMDSNALAGTFTKRHDFCGAGYNCAFPYGAKPHGLVADSAGNLFGVAASNSSSSSANGSAFELKKTPGGYSYQELYAFCALSSCADGAEPAGIPILDASGNLYGITREGGSANKGTVYELSPPGTGTVWTLRTIANFCTASCNEGETPFFGLTYAGASSGSLYDGVSTLYGTAMGGSNGQGTIYKVTGPATSHAALQVLYTFCALVGCTDGGGPNQIIADQYGNLFGTTRDGGNANGDGVAFELSPAGGGSYTEAILHTFCSSGHTGCTDGVNPQDTLTVDGSGNLYGEASGGAYGSGSIFKIVPSTSTESVLYSFCSGGGGCSDGKFPQAGLWLDSNGALWGRTNTGGANGSGTIFHLQGTSLTTDYSFCAATCSDGDLAIFHPGGLTGDGNGNIFGTNDFGGSNPNNGGGTIFEWTP